MSATSSEAGAPSWRTLGAQAAVALALRVAVAATVCALSGNNLVWLANLRDGPSYLAVARWLAGQGADPAAFDLRVFPGLPLTLAPIAAAGLPLEACSLGLIWAMAALVPPLCSIWSKSRAVGWAAVVLLPSWLMYSTALMSEAELLLFALAGALLGRSRFWPLAAVAFAVAGLTRPMACFAVIGTCLSAWRQGHRARALAIGSISLAAVLGISALLHALCGYGLHDAQTHSREYYGGQLFAWPFQSLIEGAQASVPLWKILYVAAHVLLVALACGLSLRRAPDGPLESEAAAWLLLNTLFVLCVGNVWGFHEFHRFILVALPPLFLAFAPALERLKSPLWWVAFAAISFSFSVFGLLPH